MAKNIKFHIELGGNLRFLTPQKSEFFEVIDEKRAILRLPRETASDILSSFEEKIIAAEGFPEGKSKEVILIHSSTSEGKVPEDIFFFEGHSKAGGKCLGKLSIYKARKVYSVQISGFDFPKMKEELFIGIMLVKIGQKFRVEHILSDSIDDIITKAKREIRKLHRKRRIRINVIKIKEEPSFSWEGALKELQGKVPSATELQHISRFLKIEK